MNDCLPVAGRPSTNVGEILGTCTRYVERLLGVDKSV